MTTSLFLTLLSLALLDSLNPSLFITQFYLLTTERPLARMLAYIMGVVLTNISVGLIVLAGFQTLIAQLLSIITPSTWRVLQLLVGVMLIGMGLWMRQKRVTEPTVQKPRSLRPVHTFLLGVIITLQEVLTAAPYLVAIERTAQAQMSTGANLLVLLFYNAIYVTPLLIVIGAFLAGGTRLLNRLEHINRTINLWLPRMFRYICLIGGIMLAIDATVFFIEQA